MKNKFHILFSVEVLHRFFSTGRWNELRFIPTPETVRLLSDRELLTRQVGNELLVIARVDSSGKLLQDLDLYTKFSFALDPQSPGYLNFTNIDLAAANQGLFSFSNLRGNDKFGKHFISRPLAEYKSSSSYLPGDFVRGADTRVYECIAKNPGGGSSVAPGSSPASKAAWVQQADLQFVSIADSRENFLHTEYPIELSTGIFKVRTSVKRKEHSISVYDFNTQSVQYDKEVLSGTLSFDTLEDLVQVDLRSLPAGKYRIRLNDETRFVYLVNNFAYGALPIFIDIFNLPASAPQALVDAAKKPKRTRFTIAFAARRVLWNYSTRTDLIDKIEDTDGEFIFQSDGLRKIISKKPIPFSEITRKTLQAKSGTLTVASPLPNPQADKLLDKKNDIYTTASFINY